MRKSHVLRGIIVSIALCFNAAGTLASLPSSETWVGISDFPNLKLWDSQSSTRGSYISLYFGTHTWLTAGYDQTTGGTVLLCSPDDSYGQMAFDNDTQSNNANIYENCDLREYLIGDALNEFTNAEKSLMLVTQGEYLPSNGDKLYLPNGKESSTYFTVGASDDIQISITDGQYGNVERRFWLRAPYSTGSKALAVDPRYSVTSAFTDVYNEYLVFPAVCLNINEVLFASAAQPSVSSESFSPSNTMSLRFRNDGRIKSQVLYTADKVSVKEEDIDGVYLYIQWENSSKNYVYSIKVESDMILLASDLQEDLDFSTCRIWLETLDRETNLIYAKMASEYVAVEKILLSESKLQLPIGIPHELTATVIPNNASNRDVEWKSEKEEIANVNQGSVTMIAPGTTTIIATAADNQTALCEVTSLHTVTWNDGDHTIETDTVAFGSTVKFDGSIPIKDDSIFMYWELNGTEYDESNPVKSDIVISAKWFDKHGKCGTNANYVLNADGVLVISGQGTISTSSFENNEYIKSVVINDGIAILGNAAFKGCTNLRSILIPDGLSIGLDVFRGTNLSRVVFTGDAPTGVTTYTFPQKARLYVSYKANGFSVFPWKVFHVQYSQPYSVLFESGSVLILPDNLTEIHSEAFYMNESVKAIILPESITDIGKMAFAKCSNLRGVRMPKVFVLSIEQDAFINSENIVIYGAANSEWEEYARYHIIPFESVDE